MITQVKEARRPRRPNEGPPTVQEMTVSYRIRKDFVPDALQGEGVRSPQEIADKFRGLIEYAPTEWFVVVYLDGRNNIRTWRVIAEGTPTQCMPHVRDIMAGALMSFSSAIVVLHNHPSGNTTPSREDRRFTKALRAACDAMEITMTDHLIIGGRQGGDACSSFFSFAEGGF